MIHTVKRFIQGRPSFFLFFFPLTVPVKIEKLVGFLLCFCNLRQAGVTPVNPLLYYLRIRLIQNKTDGQIGPPSVLSELLLYADRNEESFQLFSLFFFFFFSLSLQGFRSPQVREKLGGF